MQVASDGKPRLFVRARWQLGGKVAFLLSAWVLPDKNMRLVSVDTRAAGLQRMAEFQIMQLGAAEMVLILNVFDDDGDGWGEVLMGRGGYESFFLQLYEYSDEGLVFMATVLDWGC